MAFISNKQRPKIGSKVSIIREIITYEGTWERDTVVTLTDHLIDPRGNYWKASDNLGNNIFLSESEFRVI